MDKKEFNKAIDDSIMEGIKEPYPLWRRSRWDEWGSPVGLSLGWALFIIPLGVFLWLLHIAGMIK